MKVCIKAEDKLYGGLHGMFDVIVAEVADMEEAEEIGCEMSREVIGSYSDIMEYFEGELEGDFSSEKKYGDVLEDLIREDISYSIWELKDDAPICGLEDYEEYVDKWKK